MTIRKGSYNGYFTSNITGLQSQNQASHWRRRFSQHTCSSLFQEFDEKSGSQRHAPFKWKTIGCIISTLIIICCARNCVKWLPTMLKMMCQLAPANKVLLDTTHTFRKSEPCLSIWIRSMLIHMVTRKVTLTTRITILSGFIPSLRLMSNRWFSHSKTAGRKHLYVQWGMESVLSSLLHYNETFRQRRPFSVAPVDSLCRSSVWSVWNEDSRLHHPAEIQRHSSTYSERTASIHIGAHHQVQ